MDYKEFKKYVDKTNKSIADKLKDSEEELAFYTQLVKRFNDICEENAELKKKLQIKAEGFKAVNEELCEYAEKNEKLKKELEEANKKLYLCTPEIPQNVHGAYVSYVDLVNDIYESKKQHQQFIDYLEDNWKQTQDIWYVKILNKYKEIIGVSDK